MHIIVVTVTHPCRHRFLTFPCPPNAPPIHGLNVPVASGTVATPPLHFPPFIPQMLAYSLLRMNPAPTQAVRAIARMHEAPVIVETHLVARAPLAMPHYRVWSDGLGPERQAQASDVTPSLRSHDQQGIQPVTGRLVRCRLCTVVTCAVWLIQILPWREK